jgi:hypothetical protein
MTNYTFIHNLDVSSTHMDEGGSCTVVKIASTLILIIEKKITALHSRARLEKKGDRTAAHGSLYLQTEGGI